jgi:hypothetical protein
MKRIYAILIIIFLIPSLVSAHNPGGAMISFGIMIFLSLIISLFLLRFINRYVTVNNKYLKIVVLLIFELLMLFILTFILTETLGIYVYTNFFGG